MEFTIVHIQIKYWLKHRIKVEWAMSDINKNVLSDYRYRLIHIHHMRSWNGSKL